ncbi:YcfA family protein [Methanofollis liminatans DSM 4140]|uniref:YcfA family protein n=1 Tax=Methanofollis liminatans DSM 4140 TaxID=28892 RepID=J1ARI7_9EURY|nr:type II toxin-antitoxin system HicA family toxin [Methanofollis liminatans]EJG07618.1 YcfA family protein [Methanofollis liminatans DSM 4140]
MPDHKIRPVSWNGLVRGLRNFGFEGPYSGGKHPFMIRDDLVLTVPNPHTKEIGVDLLMRILKQAGISREEWVLSEER